MEVKNIFLSRVTMMVLVCVVLMMVVGECKQTPEPADQTDAKEMVETKRCDGEPTTVPRISDGVIFRVLRNLLVLDGERLSYRTLDVEQIGLRGSPTQVRRIFSPERVKGEILGDGPNDPEGAADMLVETLIEKDIVSL